MQFAPLLNSYYIILFIVLFFIVLLVSKYLKVKYLTIRIFTFIIFLICILNPQIKSEKNQFHKDIVLIVSDMTQSIKETKKDKEVLSVKNYLIKELNNLNNLEIVNIKLINEKKTLENANKEFETSLFKEINKKISNLDLNRLSSIIVITDGQIHDFNRYNHLLSKIPTHFILVGSKGEKDRILTTKNIPNYAIIGQQYNLELKIIDNISSEKIQTLFFLDGKLINTKYLTPNNIHKVKLPLFHSGKNILEIKVKETPLELSTLNNNQVYTINGIHDKLRVMLISGEPNMGLRNLRNILNSDPSIELLHFTILRPPTKRDLTPVKELSLIPFPTQELFAADISKFNLIIFDQYSLQGILPPKYLDNISKFVLSGGALLDIAGTKYLSQESLMNSPIKQILPTTPLENFESEGFKPELTKLGKRHPITNRIYKPYSEKLWGDWYNFIKSSVISGQVLMHHNNFPLLVVDDVGEGRVAQILSNQTWIWQKSQNNKGPLVELIRNTIQWLLKNPKMEEDFIIFSKENNLVKIKLNSLYSGNISASVITPSNKTINVVFNDTKNGILETEFKSEETGKFKILYNKKEKIFVIDQKNKKEIQNLRTTESKIYEYMQQNFEDKKPFSIFWHYEQLPKVIKIYNKKILSGKNWIGITENNVIKSSSLSRKSLFSWYFLFICLTFLIFLSWYKEGKD